MPLADGYAVLVGQVSSFTREQPVGGRWYHVFVEVSTPEGLYKCAIDVDSHSSNTGVEWRTVGLASDEIPQLSGLPAGRRSLAMSADAGAMDYIRSPQFKWRLGCLAIIEWLLGQRFDVSSVWKRGTSDDAANDLEPLLGSTKDNGLRIIVLGAPFNNADGSKGMHDIHQNQGDPDPRTSSDPNAARFWASDGIWQDGLTILEQPDGTFVAFLNKFTSQSYWTDDQGHPA